MRHRATLAMQVLEEEDPSCWSSGSACGTHVCSASAAECKCSVKCLSSTCMHPSLASRSRPSRRHAKCCTFRSPGLLLSLHTLLPNRSKEKKEQKERRDEKRLECRCTVITFAQVKLCFSFSAPISLLVHSSIHYSAKSGHWTSLSHCLRAHTRTGSQLWLRVKAHQVRFSLTECTVVPSGRPSSSLLFCPVFTFSSHADNEWSENGR